MTCFAGHSSFSLYPSSQSRCGYQSIQSFLVVDKVGSLFLNNRMFSTSILTPDSGDFSSHLLKSKQAVISSDHTQGWEVHFELLNQIEGELQSGGFSFTVASPLMSLVARCLHTNVLLAAAAQKLHSHQLYPSQPPCHMSFAAPRRVVWLVKSSSNGNGLDPSTSNSNGTTRLVKSLQALRGKLNSRLQELRKDAPMKFLFFLIGFYCATAFATVIGQTGDWDILSAALAVAIVEGIGALMYKASGPLFNRARVVIVMFNYWKAGLSLGLFLDSFKY